MSARTKTVTTDRRHEQLRLDLLAVIRRTAPDMPADEILAVFSVLVGQLIAMQDQRHFTSDSIMALVSENIQAGNRQAIDDLLGQVGGAA